MPELPDILLYLHALRPRILVRRVEAVRLVSPFLLRTVEPPLTALIGRTIVDLHRVGKRIVMEADGDLFLVFHLMIAGRFRWVPLDAPNAIAAASASAAASAASGDVDTARPKNRIERAMRMAHQPRADYGKDRKIGLAWQIREGDGPTLLFHNGGTGGFSSVIAFDPETAAGVVILANSASFWRREDIAVRLLEGNVAGFPGFDPSRESTGP